MSFNALHMLRLRRGEAQKDAEEMLKDAERQWTYLKDYEGMRFMEIVFLWQLMSNRDNLRCRGVPRLDVGTDGFSVWGDFDLDVCGCLWMFVFSASSNLKNCAIDLDSKRLVLPVRGSPVWLTGFLSLIWSYLNLFEFTWHSPII